MPEAPKSSENTERKLSNAELKRIIFLNFMFSQGDLTTQHNLSAWLRLHYGVQDPEAVAVASAEFLDDRFVATEEPVQNESPAARWRRTGKSKEEAEELVLAQQGLHSSSIPNELNERSPITRRDAQGQMSSIDLYAKDTAPNITEDDIAKTFLSRTIMNDNKYLESGRPGRTADSGEGLKDPFFSFFVYYILQQHRTGDPALDRLCLAAKTTLPDYTLPEELIKLVQQYNAHQDIPIALDGIT